MNDKDDQGLAERDDTIWAKGGVPVEDLPDPFAPSVESGEFPAGGAPPLDPAIDGQPHVSPQPKRRPRWLVALYAFLALFLVLLAWLVFTAPLSRALEPLDDPAMLFVSADGQPIARRGAIKLAPVEAAKLKDYTPAAFVSIEDRRFYRHWGVDPRAIGRAVVTNMKAGGVRQGGSTITQQLAKTSFLSSDRSIKRKAQEAIIAFWLEAWLTKDEILSRYLSSVYFGDGVYGLRAASRHYFNRDPEKLSLAQSAMLAGLVQAPSRLAPTKNLTGAQKRAKLVLAAMTETGAITARSARKAGSAWPVRQHRSLPTGTYFADWVSPAAAEAFASDFGEVRVPTTLDARLQRLAVRAVDRSGLGDAQVALIAMRPDGKVVAMIGGRSYKKSAFNRATQAQRQPGSAFKLFVYLAAIRSGMTPDTVISDRPITIDGWSPSNSDGTYRGDITLRDAFARSSNAATVRLAQKVGHPAIVRAARDLGVTAAIPNNPTMALGTGGLSLKELTAAYAAIYSGNYPVEPHGLEKDPEGGFSALLSAKRKLGGRERAAMLDLLNAAATTGTGKRAALAIPTFGKTGTTQENRDALFVGFAGNLVVGVWVGRDDNGSLGKVTGGSVPAKIWKTFMTSAVAVDGSRGPPLPTRYRSARNQPDKDPKQSPLPEDWSEPTKALRELFEAVDSLFAD